MEAPITVAFYVASDFYSYSSGYYDCLGVTGITSVNHAVTIIGYGLNDLQEKYFIIKNSWGTGWGDKGYWKVKIEDATICQMYKYPGYQPIIA